MNETQNKFDGEDESSDNIVNWFSSNGDKDLIIFTINIS